MLNKKGVEKYHLHWYYAAEGLNFLPCIFVEDGHIHNDMPMNR